MKDRLFSKLGGGLVVLIAGIVTLAFASAASASPPTPPFNQCVPVGASPSCETLVIINANGSLSSFSDPSVGPFDGVEDTLIGVENRSSSTAKSISLSGPNIFGLEGDGICAEGLYSPAPPECPYGPTGYEGPNTSFNITNANEGLVEFPAGLAPGASTYFSLEENISELKCTEEKCEVPNEESTTTSTSLSGGGQSGANITVPKGTSVSDQATLSGTNIASATGSVTYRVFSDSSCTTQIASSTEPVSGGAVPASEGVTLTAPGSYFWTANYSGDETNKPSSSECGAEVATVEEEGPPPPTCTSAKGEARFVRGAEAQSIVDNVSTNLSNPQVLKFRWENGAQQLTLTKLEKATCKVGAKQKTFRGSGLATVDGVENVHFTFAITVTNSGGVKIIIQFKEEKETIHFKNAARLDQEVS